jgi:hypothetical protein
MSIQIIDITENHERILELAAMASKDPHRHASNYDEKNFKKRLSNYLRFYVVVEDDTLLAFSGAYQDPSWPRDTARVGDRNYYFPIARSRSLGFKATTGYTAFNSNYLVPTQTKWCLQNGITKTFLSIQEIHRRPALKKMLSYQRSNQYYDYQLLEDLYFTCPDWPDCRVDPACWQNIISLNGQLLELPKKTIDEVKNDFKHK